MEEWEEIEKECKRDENREGKKREWKLNKLGIKESEIGWKWEKG